MRKCQMCGEFFEAYHGTMHCCESCEAMVDLEDEIKAELTDPALKATLEDKVRKRLEKP